MTRIFQRFANASDSLARLLPQASELRDLLPELKPLLKGEFKVGLPNIYEQNGLYVLSRELLQRKKKNPTVGFIPEGMFEFPTGKYIERLIVFGGHAYTPNFVENFKVGDHPVILAPKNSELRMDVKKALFYLCEYYPSRSELDSQSALALDDVSKKLKERGLAS